MSYLAPLLVLGLVIIVHEAGHFWAAKIFGVYAPRFSIGFGPALWRRRWGETEYVLGAFPLGGYVRMASRDDEATRALEGELSESKGGATEAMDPNAMIPFGPKPVPQHRWFESKPWWQRAVIMLAGVTMNVVLGVVVLSSAFAVLGRAYVRPIVQAVLVGQPAERSGLLAGDSIAVVNGKAIHGWSDVVAQVTASPGREVRMRVIRHGQPVDLAMVPYAAPDTDIVTNEVRSIGKVGMQVVSDLGREPMPLPSAVAAGSTATYHMARDVVAVLKGLVTGAISVTTLAGPVGIVRTSVVVAKSGLENLLGLIAFLSVNLAILNLLPIPLLDGGQLLLQSAESVRGSAFSDQTREWIARVGLAMIAALFLVVTFNDLKSLLGSWMR